MLDGILIHKVGTHIAVYYEQKMMNVRKHHFKGFLAEKRQEVTLCLELLLVRMAVSLKNW